ncbi:uncharacterized protein LOC128228538 [Mya arenaria]|uniref:uncharacterized protein LOC128228538 n=1 Tax=Mya arenaria TaxID=6604 RepID=UPI0022E1304E|nr:uncharacterized protein LOC128228538 [Mya arenaria]
METDQYSNSSDLDPSQDALMATGDLKLYSIVLSTTVLVLAILFGGGGCLTVLIAMVAHHLHRKLRYILIGVLLLTCSVLDLIWCPLEITRLLLYQHSVVTGNIISADVARDLQYISSAMYVLLLCTLASMIALICIQNLLKVVRKYDDIPKIKLGVVFLMIWLIISIALTITYVFLTMGERIEQVYQKNAFRFKIGVQILWIILVLILISIILALHYYTKFWKNNMVSETSDLHSTENFTVPSLIIKSVEEIDDEDIDESSVALPSPDIVKDSSGTGNDSPTSRTSKSSRCSKSALKKRSGSPSSQKVLFADNPSPTRESPSPKFGEKYKSNHLEVNMAAILGRRRHTIAQISDPQLDIMNRAKNYNYVRKFSVDISALQAQLENPKIHNNYPFHSQQDIKNSVKATSEKKMNFGSQQKCNRRSRDEILTSQEIREEPENESDNDNEDNKAIMQSDNNDNQSVHSQCVSAHSIHSPRDSICPTPPLISLTQSDGEEKQLEVMSEDQNMDDSYPSSQYVEQSHKPCKLSCLLVITFLLSILPMFITEVLWDMFLSDTTYINTVICMTAISMAQTMIFPQIIFCVDSNINKAVNLSFVKARVSILGCLHRKEPVPTNDDISDTEV